MHLANMYIPPGEKGQLFLRSRTFTSNNQTLNFNPHVTLFIFTELNIKSNITAVMHIHRTCMFLINV